MTQALFEFDSIGSRFWIERLDDSAIDRKTQAQIVAYAERIDDTYSRFKPTSLISKLARTGTVKHPSVELRSMLDYARRMHQASEGVFNITVAGVLHQMGYGDPEYGDEVLRDPWQVITWSKDELRVPPGLMLDFGGFGKGWMIDEMAAILRRNGIEQFIVNGGGDLFVQHCEPVEFFLENPHNPGYSLQSVFIQHGALAGSDTVKRSWQTEEGAKKHHIIDPATSDSSDSGITASYVIAPTALLADTLATIIIVRPDLASKLEQAFGVKTLLIE